MPWKCPVCPCINVCMNPRCASCWITKGIITPRSGECWDEFDEDRVAVRLYDSSKHLQIPENIVIGIILGEITPVTEREQLFEQFFKNERELVAAMDDAQLTAHRNELAKIAFEARARLTAADAEQDGRRKKKGEKTLSRSDELDTGTATEAVKKIGERRQRMTKEEKIRKSLEALGVSREDIDGVVRARNFNSDRPAVAKKDNGVVKPPVVIPTIKTEPAKPFVNPFAPKPKE